MDKITVLYGYRYAVCSTKKMHVPSIAADLQVRLLISGYQRSGYLMDNFFYISKGMDTANNKSVKKREGFEGQRTCIITRSRRLFCQKHSFLKGLYITDIGYFPKALFHDRERAHGSKEFVLIYCIKGSGWYSVHNKTYRVTPNQFFILNPGVPHAYGSDNETPWSIYWIHYTGENAGFFTGLIYSKSKSLPVTIPPSEQRIAGFNDMLDNLEFMNNLQNIAFANSCLPNFLLSFKHISTEKQSSENDPVKKVIGMMRDNLNRNFSLQELARYVNLSPSHFCALFKEKTQYSPLNLFTSIKIQKACHLLQNNNLHIKNIASGLGYDDQYHFSRVFKKAMGVSPRHFRNHPY